MFALKVFLVAVGTLTLLLAGIGVVRLPDAYMRMSSSTKAATMGIMCLLFAAGLHFQDTSVTTRALATICFVLLTAPVAAHMLGRAAYDRRVPLWEGTITDELQRDLQRESDARATLGVRDRPDGDNLEDTFA